MEMEYNIGYVDMVGDLFHYGHVNVLRTAKEKCKILIVGVHNNQTVESYKRTPIMNMEERIKVIESCRYVDDVIPNAPLEITNNYLDSHKIDVVFHAHFVEENEKYEFMYKNIKDRFQRIDYTKEISTTKIIEKIK